ncbi:hypothetical protein EDB85DRAFT_1889834 [Lactarius pseudohatsudake]|nr:hypothetical protein EDB85DRAFT_1889834 [Lactarius pseudohatsudake]
MGSRTGHNGINPATRTLVPEASERGSPHCDSTTAVGGRWPKVVRGRRRRKSQDPMKERPATPTLPRLPLLQPTPGAKSGLTVNRQKAAIDWVIMSMVPLLGGISTKHWGQEWETTCKPIARERDCISEAAETENKTRTSFTDLFRRRKLKIERNRWHDRWIVTREASSTSPPEGSMQACEF